MCTDKRIELGDKLRYAPMGYFSENNIGRINPAVTTDMYIIEMMAPMGIGKILNGLLHAVLLSIATFMFDWRIGLAVFTTIVLYMVFFMTVQSVSKKGFPATLEAASKLSSLYLEYVRGMSVIKAYNSESEAKDKLRRDIADRRKRHLKLELTFAPSSFALKAVLAVGAATVMLMSSAFYLNGSLSLVYAIMYSIMVRFLVITASMTITLIISSGGSSTESQDTVGFAARLGGARISISADSATGLIRGLR